MGKVYWMEIHERRGLILKIEIRKTDKRYTGNQIFKYVVDIKRPRVAAMGGSSTDFRTEKIKLFHEIRDWCIATWGMSCEREHYLSLTAKKLSANPHWCWHSDFYETKIYLADEKDANWFKLRWY